MTWLRNLLLILACITQCVNASVSDGGGGWPNSVSKSLFGGEQSSPPDSTREDMCSGRPDKFWQGTANRAGVQGWYRLYGSAYNHSEIEEICQEQGAHLMTFRNQVEYEWMLYFSGSSITNILELLYDILTFVFVEIYRTNFWVGLEIREDSFRWYDGQQYTGGDFVTTTVDANSEEETSCMYIKVV